MSGAGGGMMGVVATGVILALELTDPPPGADPLPSAADVDWTDAGGVGALRACEGEPEADGPSSGDPDGPSRCAPRCPGALSYTLP